jgi:hypothetical protein
MLIGIDDTDIVGSRGTNQLAKAIVKELADDWRCVWIIRHQLFFDPRVPYTSKNGSASICLEPRNGVGDVVLLTDRFRKLMQDDFIEGSDPGLCIASEVDESIIAFGRKCQQELVTQTEAIQIASAAGISLEGLGGTNDGQIGALAAVGLAQSGDDGRIVQWQEWTEDLREIQPVANIREREVDLRDHQTNELVTQGTVNLVKKLRPNLRGGRAVLFVKPNTQPDIPADYEAIKLT